MSVKHSDEIERSEVKDGVGVTRRVLISPSEAPNMAMRIFTIQPGGRLPLHTNLVEHEQFVLSGQARIAIGNDTIDVKKGDAVYIPAGEPHYYINTGSEPFEFLCMVPNKEDEIKMLE